MRAGLERPPQLLFNQAVELHRNGKFSEAETVYRQILAQGPDNSAAHYMLAMLCYQQQRGGEALAAVGHALRLNPGFAEALTLEGALLHDAGRHGEAVASFDKAVALRPGYAEAWYNRGVSLSEMSQPEAALASFDQAIAIRPTADAWNSRAVALQKLGRFKDALHSAGQALTLDPAMARAFHNRGSVLLAMGRNPEALAALEEALALQPEAVESLNNRGAALHNLGRYSEELESYDRALAIAPSYAQGWNNRGVALRHLKRYDEAITSFDKAIAVIPSYWDAWVNRAIVLRILRRHDEALDATQKVLAQEPGHTRALLEQGAALQETGRIAEGLAAHMKHAELTLGKNEPLGIPVAHKERHDQEQRDYLARHGVHDVAFHIAGGGRVARAINANPDIEATWRTARPQIVVIDNLLTAEALERLRHFCWGSTIWENIHPEGYLGAMPKNGFACPLLAQIAEEFSAVFPGIFGSHELRQMWAFKYDSSLSGIKLHADQAAVNVNFWITPDEANRDPQSGGLVVWDVAAPQNWDFEDYNADPGKSRDFLAQAGAKPVTIPYRANRAVIFHSDLFHETDTIRFNHGYLNRRINVTMLYGRRTADGG